MRKKLHDLILRGKSKEQHLKYSYYEKFLGTFKVRGTMLHTFTFLVDPIIYLMSKRNHKFERKEYHFLCFGSI